MKPSLPSLTALVFALTSTACITEDQEAAQEMVTAVANTQNESLPPDSTASLDSENVTNEVETDAKREPALTPDDIEADNDPLKIGFETAKWDLSPVAIERIGDVAERMRADEEMQLKIEGHCDERGTDAYNQILSEKRASTVRNALVKMGIPKDRLEVRGFGRRKALVEGQSEKVYSHNRRVEMIPTK